MSEQDGNFWNRLMKKTRTIGRPVPFGASPKPIEPALRELEESGERFHYIPGFKSDGAE